MTVTADDDDDDDDTPPLSCTTPVTSKCIHNGDGSWTARNPSASDACTPVDLQCPGACDIDFNGFAYCPGTSSDLPVVTFDVVPHLIRAGEKAMAEIGVSWPASSSQQPLDCTVTSGNTAESPWSTTIGVGQETATNETDEILAETTYTLNCTGKRDLTSIDPLTATVKIIPIFVEPAP